MESTVELTGRQQQVLELLRQEVGAREIGERLGISRNAVYQTITRLKKQGVLEEGFTPEGGQSKARPTQRLVADLTQADGGHAGQSNHNNEPPPKAQAQTSLVVELAQELARTQQELAGIANRLSRYI